MNKQVISVLKFGSSVLHRPQDFLQAAKEIQRSLEHGQRVVAVVSALDGETNRLLKAGRSVSNTGESSLLAELVATGEQQSALLLAVALEKFGVASNVATPEEIRLAAEGSTLDADLIDVDRKALLGLLTVCPVVVVPGFVGIDHRKRKTLLGRGGSDLTALFLAQRLNAKCRLIKDVDGIFDRDPAVHGSRAMKFPLISWSDALDVAGELVQPKALHYARKHKLNFEVACLDSTSGTLVGPDTTRLSDEMVLELPVAGKYPQPTC